MNQNTYHEMVNSNCLENSNDNGFRRLSKKEEKIIKILSEIKGERLIAISIRARISSGSVRALKTMIIELKEQMCDCGRERMIEVIGIDAVKLLEVL